MSNKHIVNLKGEDVVFYGDLATENLALEFYGIPLDAINDDFPYEFSSEDHAKTFHKTFLGLVKKNQKNS